MSNRKKKIKSFVITRHPPLFTDFSDRKLCLSSFCPELLLGAAVCPPKVFQTRGISGCFDGRSGKSETHTALWNHCVQQQVHINRDIIILPCYWHRPSSAQKLSAEQELSVFQQVLKMPGTTTLIFNGPLVYCSCGIRKSHWNSYHSDLEVAIFFQVLSTAYQRNSELRLTLASKRSSQHFLLIPQFDKNHHSSVWAKSVQEVMSQPLQC